jgi:NAD-dependent SIR2 family protein deacetylase
MNIGKAANLIKEADNIIICAGAGIGVDSGLPDFRGNEGFWNAYPPYKDLGLGFTDMANPSWFKTEPEFAWGFYGHRLNLYRNTVPHRGFDILLDTVNKKEDYFVFTSNVDGQFQKAGFNKEKIVECHGSIHHLQCSKNCKGIWSAENINIDVNEKTMKATGKIPVCNRCGFAARPNILMFGDWYWQSARTDEQYKMLNLWLRNKNNILVIEIGAGTAVPTVRMFSEKIVNIYNTELIRINTREPEVFGKNNISLQTGALETLVELSKYL